MRNLNRSLLRIIGWETDSTGDIPVISIKYKVFGIISFIMGIESILNFYNQATDIDSTYNAFEELIGSVMYGCMMADTWFFPQKYSYLLKLLDGLLIKREYDYYEGESLLTEKNVKQYKFSENVMAMTYLLYIIDLPFLSCITIVMLLFKEKQSKSVFRKLPYPWFHSLLFIEIESLLSYSIVIALQTVYTVLFLGMYCNSCVLISNTMMKLACELRYLVFHIKKLGFSKVDESNNFHEFKLKCDLKRLVDHHVNIIRSVRKSNQALNFLMLIYNQVLCLHISGTLYRTVKSEDLSQKCSFMFGVVLSIFVLYIICYAGQQLANESEEVTTALLESSWIDKSESFKRSLRIMITASKNQLHFRPAGLYSLDYRTFLKVIQASYSYFNLMLSINR